MSVKNLRELVQAEYDLTIAIQRAEKFIDTEADGNTNTSRSGDFPKSMLEVKEILSLAYTYSSRTSAPVNWDPAYGTSQTFATPAPLPHQLRSGNIGGLQLRRAKLDFKKDQEAVSTGKAKSVESISREKRALQSKDEQEKSQKRLHSKRPTSMKKTVIESMNLSDSSDDSSSSDDD